MANGGKIKNWSLIDENSKRKTWHHDEKPIGAEIDKKRKGWIVKKAKTRDHGAAIAAKIAGPFNTKAKARKKAVKWMRKHPNAKNV